MRPDFSGRDAAANEADGDENTVSGAQPHPGRHLLDGTVWVLLAEALLPVTGLVTAAFLTRRLGPNGYGLWVLAVSLVVWVEWSLASFFSRATIKHVGEARDWRPLGTAAVQLQFRMGSGAMVAIWILALPLARWLNEPSLATCLALLAVDIPLFALAQAHRQILAGTGAYRECAWAGAGRWLSRLLFVVLLVTAGLSVAGAILGIIGSTLLELWLYRRTLRPALFSRAETATWSLWNYSWPLFLSTVSLMVVGRMDLFAVKALGYTAEEAGLYGAAQNLALLPTLLGMAATPLLLSSLSRALARGRPPLHPARRAGLARDHRPLARGRGPARAPADRAGHGRRDQGPGARRRLLGHRRARRGDRRAHAQRGALLRAPAQGGGSDQLSRDHPSRIGPRLPGGGAIG